MSIERVTATPNGIHFMHRDASDFTAGVFLTTAELRQLLAVAEGKQDFGAADPRNDRPNTDADPDPEDTETCKCGAIIPKGYGTCDDCDETEPCPDCGAPCCKVCDNCTRVEPCAHTA